MPLTDTRWDAPVLRVGERTYTWLDVLLSAMARGEWAAFEQHLRIGAACAAAADRSEAWPDREQVEAAANAFRYARNLLSSEETEAWLTERGLDLDLWSEVLLRDVLRAQWAGRPADRAGTDLAPAAFDASLVAAEGICSGTFDIFATRLAERASVAEALGATAPALDLDATAQQVLEAHRGWLSGRDRGDLIVRLAHVARLERLEALDAEATTTPDTLAVHLDRYRLDWIRVDLERLTFPTEQAAREAAWCVREDGLTLGDVAVASRRPIGDERVLLDQLPQPMRDAVLSASPGDTVGPLTVDAAWLVAHVVAKVPATLDDALVRTRAAQSVGEARRAKAVLSHAVWLDRASA